MNVTLVSSILLFVRLHPTVAYVREYGDDFGMGPWMMWRHGFGWFWPIVMIIFWIATLVIVILIIRWGILSTGKRQETKSDESALDILKKRYARGEINKEEFEERKKDLES
jgi:putative membrane protein